MLPFNNLQLNFLYISVFLVADQQALCPIISNDLPLARWRYLVIGIFYLPIHELRTTVDMEKKKPGIKN